MMDIILYIAGILTSTFFISMLRYKRKYNDVCEENYKLSSENNKLRKYFESKESKVRKGVFEKKTVFTDSEGNKSDVYWLVEVTELEKTNDKSKVRVTNIKPVDKNQQMDNRRYNRIVHLVGEWIPTDEIEWIVNKTSMEVRTDKIDELLNEE